MANANTNKITANSNMDEEVRVYYDRVLLARQTPNVIYPLFGTPKPMPRNAGQSINFHGYNSLTAATTPLAEGVTPDGDTLVMYNIPATPLQYGKYIEITDVVDLTAPDPVLTDATELQGEQAGETYDIVVRNVLALGTNVAFSGASADERVEVGGDSPATASLITFADIQKAVRTMHTNKIKKLTSMINATTGVGTVPIPACYVGIVGASTLYDLKNLAEGWVPVEDYASTTSLLPGEVGKVDEVRFVLSDNAKVFAAEGAGSPAADVHCTLILGRDAYGVVSLSGIESIIKGFGAGDDPLNQRATCGWKAFYTAVILNQLSILRIEHTVSS